MSGPSGGMHRIVDHPEHHQAPGAYDWDGAARRRRDDAAAVAARRFLETGAGAEEQCWRCEVKPEAGGLGLCRACLDELRTS